MVMTVPLAQSPKSRLWLLRCFILPLAVVVLGGPGPYGPRLAQAWQICDEGNDGRRLGGGGEGGGGGVCPDRTTCCSTIKAGVSACVPNVDKDRPHHPQGVCCPAIQQDRWNTNFSTGCQGGYDCVAGGKVSDDKEFTKFMQPQQQGCCRATNTTMMNDPEALPIAPRYQLCTISDRSMTTLQGFPVIVEGADHDSSQVYHLGYYSNHGPVTQQFHREEEMQQRLKEQERIEKVIVVIHGSLRDADDYFCTILSLLSTTEKHNVLILAPLFATVDDPAIANEDQNNYLVWDLGVEADNRMFWHPWRFGADAANAPISSYMALDRIVEHLVLSSTHPFPNLQQITVVGHSAGGQLVQRWSLLSNSPVWDGMNIRAVVANPRSFCYLDDRRLFSFVNDTAPLKEAIGGTSIVRNETRVFRRPTQQEIVACPEYNQWNWGLDSGGELLCPYKDRAIADVGGSVAIVAERYRSRDVIYLSAKQDVQPQLKDCASVMQGTSRRQRAQVYFEALQEYFSTDTWLGVTQKSTVHELRSIPHSNHDHALMFQSALGRDAILGTKQSGKEILKEDNVSYDSSSKLMERGVSQSDRFIVPGDE